MDLVNARVASQQPAHLLSHFLRALQLVFHLVDVFLLDKDQLLFPLEVKVLKPIEEFIHLFQFFLRFEEI